MVFENAPRFTRMAADELADYMEKITGVRPEVIEGAPDPVPETAIWVGYQPVMDDLFPDHNFDFEHPEEILIAATEDHLAIAGRDRWDPDHLDVEARHFEWGNRDVEGFQQEYGTTNAVYTFIQDYLDVRWLWPGEIEVPERETIAVSSSLEHRHHPQIRQRYGIFWNRALHRSGGRPGRPEGDWMRYQRVQLDSLHAHIGGHAFADWWDRFHETNPEFFALQPDGTRSGYPAPRYAKLCVSNPAVWDQWLTDVEKILEENPNRRAFSVAANDSWTSGHCICENCRAWDHPEGKRRRFSWQGLGQDYVALSDRQVTFANKMARRLKDKYPDEDYMVTMLSYGLSRPVPVEAVPDDNVIVGSVHSFFQRRDLADRASPEGVTHREQFKGWADIASNIAWRPNLSPYFREGGPMDLQHLIEDFKLVADAGGIGIYIDSFWYYWATKGPAFYLMAQLAWDPYADGEAIIQDYCEHGFGPAADAIEAYWSLLGDKRKEIRENDLTWLEGFDDGFFQRARAHLDEAADAVSDEPRYARRVEFFAAGLEFLRLNTANRALMERLETANGDDAEALARAWENWDRLVEIARQYPQALNRNFFLHSPPGRLTAIYPGKYGER